MNLDGLATADPADDVGQPVLLDLRQHVVKKYGEWSLTDRTNIILAIYR